MNNCFKEIKKIEVAKKNKSNAIYLQKKKKKN